MEIECNNKNQLNCCQYF